MILFKTKKHKRRPVSIQNYLYTKPKFQVNVLKSVSIMTFQRILTRFLQENNANNPKIFSLKKIEFLVDLILQIYIGAFFVYFCSFFLFLTFFLIKFRIGFQRDTDKDS